MQPSTTDTSTLQQNETLLIAVALVCVAVFAAAIALIASGIVRRFLIGLEGEHAAYSKVHTATIRGVGWLTFIITMAALSFPALDFAGVDIPVGLKGEDLAAWMTRTGIRISGILVVAFAANRLIGSVITRAEREIGATSDDVERRRRAQTLAATLRRFLTTALWSVTALVLLRELDVDITPVLTGAGILGLAIGFGAQTLVRDIISGFFLIVEDQVRVGDVAIVNGTGGSVEQVNLRTIVLRDGEGVVHVFPNGEIKTLANRSKDFSYYVINLGVGYDDDTDDIVAAVQDAGAELQNDPLFSNRILAPLEVMGVDDFKESSVTLSFRIKTRPLAQWDVGRELRRRIKKTLDARGIRLPSPQLAITIKREPAKPR